MYFFYFLAINALRMSSKYFIYKWRVGDKSAEFGKIVFKNLKNKYVKNNYARYMLKSLFTSVSVNSLDINLAPIHNYSPPLR